MRYRGVGASGRHDQMFLAKALKSGSVLALSTVVTVCVTSPNAFDRHDWYTQNRRSAAAAANLEFCPVLVANRTSDMLDAGYRLDGVAKELGVIPEGGIASFDVRCAFGKIEAYVSSGMGVMAGPGHEYRKMAKLDLHGVTTVESWGGDRGR